MKHIYLLSGLGADERIFQCLDLSGYSVTYVQWLQPFKQESMQQYAQRLLAQIPTPKPIMIGLSFGGMVAVEIAKLIETEKLLLISSAKNKWEIPFYYRLAGKLTIHKLLPPGILANSNWLSSWFFGANTAFDKKLLKTIMKEADPVFVKWALDKIVTWQNTTPPINCIHIHGTSDLVLPASFATSNYLIPKGGHLMVLNRAQEMNVFIRGILDGSLNSKG